jgi:hypothetical protein
MYDPTGNTYGIWNRIVGGEEVHRHHTLYVIPEERLSGLGWRSPAADHVFADAGFANLDAELEQFAADPGSAPRADSRGSSSESVREFPSEPPAARLAMSNLPPPEKAKALAVPTEDCRSFHKEDPGLPILPDPTEPCPQESIRGRQFRPLHGALKDSELVAQRENLHLERSTAPRRGGK